MTRIPRLMLAVVIAIVAAKAIVTVKESFIIAVAIMTIGLIDYAGSSSVTKHFASWLVLTGAVTMFFSLFGSALPSLVSPVRYIVLGFLGVIVFTIIMGWWTKIKLNKEWTPNKERTMREAI